MPPRRHRKNVRKRKHGVISSIFLRLLEYNPSLNPTLGAQQDLRFTNYLYGSHLLSDFELAHGFYRSHGAPPVALIADIFEAQATLSAKHSANWRASLPASQSRIFHCPSET